LEPFGSLASHVDVIRKINKIIGPDSFRSRQLPLRQLSKPENEDVHLWHLDFNQLSNPMNSEGSVDFEDLSVFQQRANRRFYLRLLLGANHCVPRK
jgi:hypothetical protein